MANKFDCPCPGCGENMILKQAATGRQSGIVNCDNCGWSFEGAKEQYALIRADRIIDMSNVPNPNFELLADIVVENFSDITKIILDKYNPKEELVSIFRDKLGKDYTDTVIGVVNSYIQMAEDSGCKEIALMFKLFRKEVLRYI